MSPSYYPQPGDIVVCHYGLIAMAPEIIKTRPVIEIGPRLRRRAELVAVVPLSTTAPTTIESYHCRITLPQPQPAPFDNPVMWAKCDLVSSVSLQRLDRFREPKNRYGGARKWSTSKVDAAQLLAVRHGVLCGLGLESLTKQSKPTT